MQLRGRGRLLVAGGVPLGPVDELLDLVELLAGQVARADGLVDVGPDDLKLGSHTIGSWCCTFRRPTWTSWAASISFAEQLVGRLRS